MHISVKKLRFLSLAGVALVFGGFPLCVAADSVDIINTVSVRASSGNGGNAKGSVHIETIVNGTTVESIDEYAEDPMNVRIEKTSEIRTNTVVASIVADDTALMAGATTTAENTAFVKRDTFPGDHGLGQTEIEVEETPAASEQASLSFGQSIVLAFNHLLSYVFSFFNA